jgi:hypothetical protein
LVQFEWWMRPACGGKNSESRDRKEEESEGREGGLEWPQSVQNAVLIEVTWWGGIREPMIRAWGREQGRYEDGYGRREEGGREGLTSLDSCLASLIVFGTTIRWGSSIAARCEEWGRWGEERSHLELLHEAHDVKGQLHGLEQLGLVEATLEHPSHGDVVDTDQMVALADQIEATGDDAAAGDDGLIVEEIRHLAALASERQWGREWEGGRGGSPLQTLHPGGVPETDALDHEGHRGGVDHEGVDPSEDPLAASGGEGRVSGGEMKRWTNLPTSSVCL